MACDTNIDSSGAAIHDAVDSNIMLGVDGGGGNSAKNNGTSTSCGNKSMLMLGYHGTRTILFRAILRPLHNNSDGTNAGQEQARKGAMACARAFTAYIEGLTLDDFQSFWPFCKCLLMFLLLRFVCLAHAHKQSKRTSGIFPSVFFTRYLEQHF